MILNDTNIWTKYNFNEQTLILIKETEELYNDLCLSEMEYYGEEPFYFSDWVREYFKQEFSYQISEADMFLIALNDIRKSLLKFIN